MGDSGSDAIFTMFRRVLKRKITTAENFEVPAKALKTFLQDTVTPGFCYTHGAEYALSKVSCIFALYIATGAKHLARRENRKRILGTDIFKAVNSIEADTLMARLNKVLPEYRKKKASNPNEKENDSQNTSDNNNISASAILDEVITIDSDSDDEEDDLMSNSSLDNDASCSDNSNDDVDSDSDQLEIIDRVYHDDSDQLEIIDTVVGDSGKKQNCEEISKKNLENDNSETKGDCAQTSEVIQESILQESAAMHVDNNSQQSDVNRDGKNDTHISDEKDENVEIVEVSENAEENIEKEETINVDSVEIHGNHISNNDAGVTAGSIPNGTGSSHTVTNSKDIEENVLKTIGSKDCEPVNTELSIDLNEVSETKT